jgi:hypothetical protein
VAGGIRDNILFHNLWVDVLIDQAVSVFFSQKLPRAQLEKLATST